MTSREKEKEATTSEKPGAGSRNQNQNIGHVLSNSQNSEAAMTPVKSGAVMTPAKSGAVMTPAKSGAVCHNARSPAKKPCHRYVHVISGEPCQILQVPFFGAKPPMITCPAVFELLMRIKSVWKDPDSPLNMEGVEAVTLEESINLEIHFGRLDRNSRPWSPFHMDCPDILDMLEDLNVDRVSDAQDLLKNSETVIANLLAEARLHMDAEAERREQEAREKNQQTPAPRGPVIARCTIQGQILPPSPRTLATPSASAAATSSAVGQMTPKQVNGGAHVQDDVHPIDPPAHQHCTPANAKSGVPAALQKAADLRTPSTSAGSSAKRLSTPAQAPSDLQNPPSGAPLAKTHQKQQTPVTTPAQAPKTVAAPIFATPTSRPGQKMKPSLATGQVTTPATAHSSGATPVKTSQPAQGNLQTPLTKTTPAKPATGVPVKTPTSAMQSAGAAKSAQKAPVGSSTPASVRKSQTPSRPTKESAPTSSGTKNAKSKPGSCKSVTPASTSRNSNSRAATPASSQAKQTGKAGRPKKNGNVSATPAREVKQELPDEVEDQKPDIEQLKLKVQKKRTRVSEAQKLLAMDFGPKEGGRLADIDAGLGVTRRRTQVIEPQPEPPKTRLRSPSRRKATNRTGFKEADTSEEEDEEEEEDDVEDDDDDDDEDYVEPGAKRPKLDDRCKSRQQTRETAKPVAQIANKANVPAPKPKNVPQSSAPVVQPTTSTPQANPAPIRQPIINVQNRTNLIAQNNTVVHPLDRAGLTMKKLQTINGQLGFFNNGKFVPVTLMDKPVPEILLSRMNATNQILVAQQPTRPAAAPAAAGPAAGPAAAPAPGPAPAVADPAPWTSPDEMTIKELLQPRTLDDLSRHKLFNFVLKEIADCFPKNDFRMTRISALRQTRKLIRQIVRSKRFRQSPPRRARSLPAPTDVGNNGGRQSRSRSRRNRRRSAPPLGGRDRDDSLFSRSRSPYAEEKALPNKSAKKTVKKAVRKAVRKADKKSKKPNSENDEEGRVLLWAEFSHEKGIAVQQKELEGHLKSMQNAKKTPAVKKNEILAQLNGTPIKMMPLETIRHLADKSTEQNKRAYQSPPAKRRKTNYDNNVDISPATRKKRESYINAAIESVVNGTANHDLLGEPNLPRVSTPHTIFPKNAPVFNPPTQDVPSTSGPSPAHQYAHLNQNQKRFVQQQQQQIIQRQHIQQQQQQQQQYHAGLMQQQLSQKTIPPPRPYRPKKETALQEKERRDWITSHYEKERQVQQQLQQQKLPQLQQQPPQLQQQQLPQQQYPPLQNQQKLQLNRSSAARIQSSSSASPAPILEANSPIQLDDSDDIIEIPAPPTVSKLVPIAPNLTPKLMPIRITSINLRSPSTSEQTPVRIVPAPLAQPLPKQPAHVQMKSPVRATPIPTTGRKPAQRLPKPTQQKRSLGSQPVQLRQEPPVKTTPAPNRRVVPASAPVAVPPAPVAGPPTPVALPPTPVALPPTPVAVLPTPVAVLPTPVAVTPAPVAVPPAPVAVPPVPVAVPPTPVAVPPTPVAVPPTPVALPPTPVALPPTPVGLSPKQPLVSSSPAAATSMSPLVQPMAVPQAEAAPSTPAPPPANEVRPSMIRSSIAPGDLPVKPEPFERLYDAGCEVFIPPNKTIDYRAWKTADLLIWLENVLPSAENASVHEKMREEEMDGFFVADAAMCDFRKELDISCGPWRKIKTHAAAVMNQYHAEKYATLMAEYEEKLQKLREKDHSVPE